jgi:cob(I)alamin adenosyltransferase
VKIYTRTGDRGETALFGAGRVSKAHARVEAYGTVDELNATLGWAVLQVSDASIQQRLRAMQHDLFTLGADLASPPVSEGRRRPDTPDLPTARIAEMESWMDDADAELPALRAFVLPGGTPGAAALHVCRTVCRRAERGVVRLAEAESVSEDVVRYLNRLSDLLFTLARLENLRSGTPDVEWKKGGNEG